MNGSQRVRCTGPLLLLPLILAVVASLAACKREAVEREEMPLVAEQQAGPIRVEVSAPGGKFTAGENHFHLSFRDSAGEPSPVSDVRAEFHMPAMDNMPAMQHEAELSKGGSGEFEGRVNLSMAGKWEMKISFASPEGMQKTQISITAE